MISDDYKTLTGALFEIFQSHFNSWENKTHDNILSYFISTQLPINIINQSPVASFVNYIDITITNRNVSISDMFRKKFTLVLEHIVNIYVIRLLPQFFSSNLFTSWTGKFV